MDSKQYSYKIGEKKLLVEINNWAEQASGSVLVRLGDTMVLATATLGAARTGGDFFPLTVEYEERFYAVGKILGSRFIKREARPSEEAILAARMIDRAIRPRFDMRMRNEVQIVITVLSIDEENDPDIPALLAASLALSLSNIPWGGPIAGIRVGKIGEKLIANPSYQERSNGELDLVIAGTREHINMIEAGAQEVSEETFAKAVEWGFSFFNDLISFQKEIIEKHGRQKTKNVTLVPTPDELKSFIKKEFSDKLEEAIYQQDKNIMREKIAALKEECLARATEEFPELFDKGGCEYLFDEEISEIVHKKILEKGERPDNRKPDELRPLFAAVGVLPRVHGSGLFMRGKTHALSILTLDSPGQEQIIESIELRGKKRFLHHYNFPPYSTGEIKPMRGPGRREIGHGALTWKALLPIIPSKDEFPYTIRIVSEILSSNGSTSMASVCGSSLALMDAGVPIKKAVAGIAMGLMVEKQKINAENQKYTILTDLQGPEDHYGDMDFKVAGTKDGITAVQLDVKIEGLTLQMIKDTLKQAHDARFEILKVMESAISRPRPELSPWAPRVQLLKINPEKIGTLIGPGGKVINEIIESTGTTIDIENDGSVFVTSDKEDGMRRALALIKQITKEFKPGELTEGTVTRILDFGAFVEIAPRQEGLIHISELAPWRVDKVTDIVKVGEVIPVKIKEIDEQGRINLSLKDVPGRYSKEEIERGKKERFGMPRMQRGKITKRLPH